MPKKKKEKTVQSPRVRTPVRVTTTDTAAQPLAALDCLEDEEIRHKKTKSKPDNVQHNGPDSCSGVETEEGELQDPLSHDTNFDEFGSSRTSSANFTYSSDHNKQVIDSGKTALCHHTPTRKRSADDEPQQSKRRKSSADDEPQQVYMSKRRKRSADDDENPQQISEKRNPHQVSKRRRSADVKQLAKRSFGSSADEQPQQILSSVGCPWKEVYFQYKDGLSDARSMVNRILEDELLKGDMILKLGRYARKFLATTEEQNRGILQDVPEPHPQFSLAQTILKAFGRVVDTHLSEVIPLLVMCSRSVHEVHSLVSQIMSLHGLNKTTELLYCLATLFFALWTEGLLSPRYHYFLFYSLNVLERSELRQSAQELKSAKITHSRSHTVGKSPAVQQSLRVECITNDKGETARVVRGIKPKSTDVLTHEQMGVVNHSIRDGEVLKVVALAGTGKTTTLVKFSETFLKNSKNPDAKLLYCVFNRSVMEYAKKLFPEAVDVRTFHSLAYVGLDMKKTFKNKLCKGINVLDVAKYISGKKIGSRDEDLRVYIRAKYILKTLQTFLASEDDTISAKHVPSLHDEDSKHIRQDPEKYRQKLESETVDLWEKMRDPTEKSVKITDDGYLKLFQLQEPALEYDCILVDEAQDLTPAQISIVLRQKCGKVFVGDPHQQIYSFRLAVNAMKSVEASTTLYLTQAFRFGPEVALVASYVLSNLKHERNQTLVGSLERGGVDGEKEGQVAIIARKNSTLFDEMVTVCTQLEESSKIIGFAGGLAGYGLDEVVDIHNLKTGKKDAIKKKSFIKRFETFQHLKTYARDAEDARLWGKIYICEKYGQKTEHHVQMIEQHKTPINRAKIVFSTAHKAKGLEFATVKLCDDFLQEKTDEVEPNADEKNLLYVAVTRARKRLVMSPYLVALLQKEKEEFIYPMSVSSPGDHNSINCAVCSREKSVPPLLFQKTAITLSTNEKVPGGNVCRDCLSLRMPYWNPVLEQMALKSSESTNATNISEN